MKGTRGGGTEADDLHDLHEIHTGTRGALLPASPPTHHPGARAASAAGAGDPTQVLLSFHPTGWITKRGL
jgi:hypothetical protein